MKNSDNNSIYFDNFFNKLIAKKLKNFIIFDKIYTIIININFFIFFKP